MSLKDIQSLISTPDMQADAIMKCALGVRTTEMEAYCALATKGPSTVQDIADILGKSRSTAQRLLQNLADKKLATREEKLIGLGGYQYQYRATSPDKMKKAVRETLDIWYNRMIDELDSLPNKLEEMGKNCMKLI
jgi:predicted transcriptional regulator